MIKRFSLIFIILTAVFIACNDREIRCPVDSLVTQNIMLSAFLVLDENNNPGFIEIRKQDLDANYWFRKDRIILKAYGATDVKMNLDFDGVIFSLYRDTAGKEPDTVLTLDVYQQTNLLEIDIN